MNWVKYMEEELGYKCITTFWMDFTMADKFGLEAVQDTYDRVFNEWGKDYKYLTELVLVLNHKSAFYAESNKELAELYAKLYYTTDAYAWSHLKGEEQDYYFRITD